MNIVSINTCDYGSTGKIMLGIAQRARLQGISYYTFSRKWVKNNHPKQNHFFFGLGLLNVAHRIFGSLLGLSGFFSVTNTLILIKKIKSIKPSLIHLHNIHGNYICFPLLFYFVKKNKIPIVWTLHDCWSFTGRCPYFDIIKCSQWENGCRNCRYPSKAYPQSYLNMSAKLWKIKYKCFTGLENCTIVTPSFWLANLVKKSFLNYNAVKVINNGIDLSTFHPIESSFRKKYNLEEKKIILGVAFGWERRKGLDVFIELSKRFMDDYQIVLVGTNNKIDEKLPRSIMSLHRTHNQKELAEIYSSADVFVNPTREENYPTVNMEAIACGTPVVTFKTGGCAEILDESSGYVVECDDIDAMESKIRNVCENHPFSSDNLFKKAKEFDMNSRFDEYVKTYLDVLN